MNEQKFYYRFNAVFVEDFDEKSLKKYCSELKYLSELDGQFEKLQRAFVNAEKERADIIVNAYPELSGVAELSVFHQIKFKLFSKTVKKNVFTMCATSYGKDGDSTLYFYETADFEQVKRWFTDFIEKGQIPDFTHWEKHYIG